MPFAPELVAFAVDQSARQTSLVKDGGRQRSCPHCDNENGRSVRRKNPREISHSKFSACGTYSGKLPFTGLFCYALFSPSASVGRVDHAFQFVSRTYRRSSRTYFHWFLILTSAGFFQWNLQWEFTHAPFRIVLCRFVPFRAWERPDLTPARVDVRLIHNVDEVLFKRNRICSHLRLHGRHGQYSTQEAHMPPDH